MVPYDKILKKYLDIDVKVEEAEKFLKEKLKEKVTELSSVPTEWSYAADKFLQWVVENDFKLKSYELFEDYILVEYDAEPLLEEGYVWDFFFGYGEDFEKFADYWIVDEERESYLAFAQQE